MNNDEEKILACLQDMRSGSESAKARAKTTLNQVFTSHQDWVYAVCYRFVGDPERARELAQETFLVAFTKLLDFRGESKFRTWLYGIAKRLCFNALRKRSEMLTQDGVFTVQDPARSALSSMRRREREDLIRQAAAAVLDPLEQEAVSLRYIERLPQERITEILGIEASSGARGVLQTCRRKLEREIRRRLEELGHGVSFLESTL